MDGRMVEEWRDIPGFEGDYQVSTNGAVKSYKLSREGRMLKQCLDRYGYLKVILYKDNKPHYFTVHRLVALTFLTKEDGKNSVDHIDFNRTNNNIKNLRWCTGKENTIHSYNAGRLASLRPRGVSAVSPDGEKMYFPSMREAERITGVSMTAIRNRINGKMDSIKGWYFYKEKE